MKLNLEVETPAWAEPLLEPARYKGAKGGRSSGKSHFFAERMIIRAACDPCFSAVALREVLKSLKYSSKKLLENKIVKFKLQKYFNVTNTEIGHRFGPGVIIFQGMQDHTADSIKSLEEFDVAWFDEAHRASARSLRLLRPTIIRKGSAELWFSWNPDQPEDPVDKLFREHPPEGSVLVHVNYDQNPFLPEGSVAEIKQDLAMGDMDDFDHIWLGGYNKKSHAQVFKDKWIIEEFEPQDHWEVYHGADWGFSQDPTALVRCYTGDGNLYIDYEVYKVGLEIKDTAEAFAIAGKNKIRADNARPETISHIKNTGMNIEAADKWPGSVEDGITYMRNFNKIIIHPRCVHTIKEFRLYSYFVNKAEDVTTKIVDKWNHIIDAIRYALAPLIKATSKAGMSQEEMMDIHSHTPEQGDQW